MSDEHGEILTQSWREEHAKAGDRYLRGAESAIPESSTGMGYDRAMVAGTVAAGLAAIAQAHYAAANVRARPAQVTRP